MKHLCLLLIIVLSNTVFSQSKTCNTPEPSLEDINAITKCQVKSSSKNKSKKADQISVRVSANKTRFLKKRKNKSTSFNGVDSKGVAIKTENSTKTISLVNLLSLEEVKKADRFIDVDEIPAFEKCASTKGDTRVNCFNKEMVKHIEKYFNYPDEAIIKKIEGEVWVRFIIDSNGTVTNIKTHTKSHQKLLKEEALRVVSYLPKFAPAIKKGKPVSVKYGFPINFSLGE